MDLVVNEMDGIQYVPGGIMEMWNVSRLPNFFQNYSHEKGYLPLLLLTIGEIRGVQYPLDDVLGLIWNQNLCFETLASSKP